MVKRTWLEMSRVAVLCALGGYFVSLLGSFFSGMGFPSSEVAKLSGVLVAVVSSAAIFLRKPKLSDWSVLGGVLLTGIVWYLLEGFFGW